MINVGVVVPTLTNKEGGYEALQSIKGSYDIMWMPIIMDNWRVQRALSASWNEGIEIAITSGCQYILVINDDVLFSPWTLAGMIKVFLFSDIPNLGMVTGMNIRGSTQPYDILSIDIPPHEPHNWAENPDFACFMLTPEVFARVGKFDENFNPAYFEDNDYHYRMKLYGLKAISSSWAPYYHYGSVTQNKNVDIGQPVVNSFQFENNRAYYIGKWGGEPGRETFQSPYNELGKSPSTWKFLSQ
jgi:hypothetical protein